MPIKVLVNGAFGQMGQLATKAINADTALELVGETGRDSNLKKAIRDSGAVVVVDFTHPASVYANALIMIEENVHPVIGTSGLTLAEINTLQEKSAQLKLGGIIAPNFSLGAVLMMKYAKEIVKYMPDVEIIEMHHNKKIDSPSGTALRSAELLARSRHIADLSSMAPPKTETIAGARGARHQGIAIHSIRLPGLLAHQQIIFGNTGETLTLRHDSIDRQCFMQGVCLAAAKVIKLDALVYGLEEVL